MKARGAAEGKRKLPSWFLEKDLPWWQEWGAATPKRELPSWFLEEDLPWWPGSIHPCDEEFVDQWFARLSEEKGKGSGRGPQAKGNGKRSEKGKRSGKAKNSKGNLSHIRLWKGRRIGPKKGQKHHKGCKVKEEDHKEDGHGCQIL